MAKIKKNDFVEVDFTGKIKETGEIFDTTVKKVADENKLTDKADYKPVIVCVSQGHIFKKIEILKEVINPTFIQADENEIPWDKYKVRFNKYSNICADSAPEQKKQKNH